MKTASSHSSFVFAHFDFVTVTENLHTGAMINHSADNLNLGHCLSFPPNHSNMSFICTMRHPYYRGSQFLTENFWSQQKNLRLKNLKIFPMK